MNGTSIRWTVRAALPLGLSLVVWAAGCGGAKPAPTSGGAEGPAWMSRGSGGFAVERGRVFYGVGSAQGASAAVRRKDADARARLQLAATLDGYAGRLAKAASGGDGAAEAEIGTALHTLGNLQAPGARVLDHFVQGGSEYAVSMLELEAYKAAVDRAGGLSTERKDAVKAAAETVFDQQGEAQNG